MRDRRLDPDHGIHHVYDRSANRWILFLDDVDRRCFVRELARACEDRNVVVLAFCLMDNHFHLVLRCPDGGISATMHDLKSRYARYYNDRHQYSGPVFENRSGSKLVRSWDNLRHLVRYVHLNPLDIHPNIDLAAYVWSSHGNYLGHRPLPKWLRPNMARELFPSNDSDYREAVERPAPGDKHQNRGSGTVVLPGSWSKTFTPSQIRLAVARAACVDVAQVLAGRRNGLVGLAVLPAKDLGGYDAAEIADPFGFRSPGAVRTASTRAKQLLKSDEHMTNVCDGAAQILLSTAA